MKSKLNKILPLKRLKNLFKKLLQKSLIKYLKYKKELQILECVNYKQIKITNYFNKY